MRLLEKYNLKFTDILKYAGIGLVGIILLAVAFRMLGPIFGSVMPRTSRSVFQSDGMGMASSKMMAGEASMDMATEEVGLSVRNIAPSPEPPVDPGSSVGDDAEDYEVTEYYGTIETRHLDDDCQKLQELKKLDYVIFEHAKERDKSCNYRLKVKSDKADSVLAIIDSLEPKEMTKNTKTIKKLLEDYTSQTEILEKKLWNVEQTLEDAIESYDAITKVATNAANAESLAQIIESKLRILERLTNERININAQLERLGRSKAEQLDRLEYIRFNLTVRENKFIDGEQLRDSWKAAVKRFVQDVNQIAQDVSVRLVTVILTILQWALYLLIFVVVLKYGWRAVRWIWKK